MSGHTIYIYTCRSLYIKRVNFWKWYLSVSLIYTNLVYIVNGKTQYKLYALKQKAEKTKVCL